MYTPVSRMSRCGMSAVTSAKKQGFLPAASHNVPVPPLLRDALVGSGIFSDMQRAAKVFLRASRSLELHFTPKMSYSTDVECQDFSFAWHVASEVGIIT